MHGLRKDLGGFSSAIRADVAAKTDVLTAQLQGFSSQLDRLFSRLDEVSAQIKDASSQNEARFASIDARLEDLASDATVVQGDDSSRQDTLPGEESILPGSEDDLDLSLFETIPSSGGAEGADISLLSGFNDALNQQNDDVLVETSLVGVPAEPPVP